MRNIQRVAKFDVSVYAIVVLKLIMQKKDVLQADRPFMNIALYLRYSILLLLLYNVVIVNELFFLIAASPTPY